MKIFIYEIRISHVKRSLSSAEAYMKFLVRERERARSDGKS
jgi:hypothetical protein